jgi:hypothetical protein
VFVDIINRMGKTKTEQYGDHGYAPGAVRNVKETTKSRFTIQLSSGVSRISPTRVIIASIHSFQTFMARAIKKRNVYGTIIIPP